MQPRRFSRGVGFLLAAAPLGGAAWHASQPREILDPVARLQRDLAQGRVSLSYDENTGYLRDILARLEIPVESQTLVFSKTSLQSGHISRSNPRALYFSDTVYVGYIPGAPLLEIMSVHPQKGPLFYVISNRKGDLAELEQDGSDCFRCHQMGRRGPAMLLARSVFPSPAGYSRPFSPDVLVQSHTPFERRWGGWYVTGQHGRQRHLGNVVSSGGDDNPVMDKEAGANQMQLPKEVALGRYLSPHSDLVALLVQERQMDVQNALGWAHVAAARETGAELQDSMKELVDALLGEKELRLTDPVRGTSRFAEEYVGAGKRDRQGRSLRELDLTTRLYRYGCHPLIESESFDALPKPAQDSVWEELDRRLTARQDTTLREMLKSLKPAFAAWRP